MPKYVLVRLSTFLTSEHILILANSTNCTNCWIFLWTTYFFSLVVVFFYWPFKWYKLCSLSSRLIHFLFVLGAWLLFKASSAIVQLYHGKNKLILMRWRCSSLCSIPIRLLVCYPRLPLVFHHRLLLVFQPR
jgi:hypothetical protein